MRQECEYLAENSIFGHSMSARPYFSHNSLTFVEYYFTKFNLMCFKKQQSQDQMFFYYHIKSRSHKWNVCMNYDVYIKEKIEYRKKIMRLRITRMCKLNLV